jgi:hypothetical protein
VVYHDPIRFILKRQLERDVSIRGFRRKRHVVQDYWVTFAFIDERSHYDLNHTVNRNQIPLLLYISRLVIPELHAESEDFVHSVGTLEFNGEVRFRAVVSAIVQRSNNVQLLA